MFFVLSTLYVSGYKKPSRVFNSEFRIHNAELLRNGYLAWYFAMIAGSLTKEIYSPGCVYHLFANA